MDKVGVNTGASLTLWEEGIKDVRNMTNTQDNNARDKHVKQTWGTMRHMKIEKTLGNVRALDKHEDLGSNRNNLTNMRRVEKHD